METTKYYAFISYKREDERWAKWLQRRLEYYHLPLNVRKENPSLPKTVRPVFKDTTDLSGGVLEKAINEALESSQYLIVVCSPRAAQSRWVCKEVQRFIDLGKAERIIPFIVGGTPNSSDPQTECFPESLRALNGSRELLGININENGREAAVVKVVARMFNIQFDTLWQRYRKARRVRIATGVALVSALALLFAFFSFWIAAKNRQLEQQNDIILRERSAMLAAQSRAVAEKANQLVEAGDVQTARALAMRVLPPGRPYVAEAEIALRNTFACGDSLYVPFSRLRGENGLVGAVSVDGRGTKVAFADNTGFWLHDVATGNEIRLEADDIVEALFTAFTSDDKRLVGITAHNLYVWDAATGTLQSDTSLFDLEEAEDLYYTDEALRDFLKRVGIQIPDVPALARLQDAPLLEIAKHDVTLRDATTGRRIASYRFRSDEWGDSIAYVVNPAYEEILFSGHDRTILYDHRRREVVQTFPPMYDDIVFSGDGRLLLALGQIYMRNGESPAEVVPATPILSETDIERSVEEGEFGTLPTHNGAYAQKAAGHTVHLNPESETFDIYTGANTWGAPELSVPLRRSEEGDFAYESVIYAFLPDEGLLLEHPDGTVEYYDLSARRPLKSLPARAGDGGVLRLCDYDGASHTVFLTDYSSVYTWDMDSGKTDSLMVIRPYSIGNGAEMLTGAMCVDEHHLLALVGQGDHRVIDRRTGEVMFMLEYGYWLDGVGREPRLSHAESYVAEIKYVKSLDQLYTLSSGGVLRVYDMASGKMLQCVPLPEAGDEPGCTPLAYWHISDDGTSVEYAYAGERVKYAYHVVTLQELMDSVRPQTDKRTFSAIEKNAYYLSD